MIIEVSGVAFCVTRSVYYTMRSENIDSEVLSNSNIFSGIQEEEEEGRGRRKR